MQDPDENGGAHRQQVPLRDCWSVHVSQGSSRAPPARAPVDERPRAADLAWHALYTCCPIGLPCVLALSEPSLPSSLSRSLPLFPAPLVVAPASARMTSHTRRTQSCSMHALQHFAGEPRRGLPGRRASLAGTSKPHVESRARSTNLAAQGPCKCQTQQPRAPPRERRTSPRPVLRVLNCNCLGAHEPKRGRLSRFPGVGTRRKKRSREGETKAEETPHVKERGLPRTLPACQAAVHDAPGAPGL